MKEIGGFFARLTSRKFLLTIGAVAVLLANNQFAEATAIILAFITAEGAADAVSRYSVEKTKQSSVYASPSMNLIDPGADDDINENVILPGNTAVEPSTQPQQHTIDNVPL